MDGSSRFLYQTRRCRVDRKLIATVSSFLRVDYYTVAPWRFPASRGTISLKEPSGQTTRCGQWSRKTAEEIRRESWMPRRQTSSLSRFSFAASAAQASPTACCERRDNSLPSFPSSHDYKGTILMEEGRERKLNAETGIANRKDTIRISIRARKALAFKRIQSHHAAIKFAVLNGSFQFRARENFSIRKSRRSIPASGWNAKLRNRESLAASELAEREGARKGVESKRKGRTEGNGGCRSGK